MKEITITKKLYNAKELNEMFPKAFEKAIMDNANNQWSCIYDWWKDDFKQLLSLVGIDLEKMYYSGFGSQGDGLCFDATFYYEPNALEKVKEYAPVDTKLFPLIETYIALQKEQEFKGKVKQ